MELPTRYFWTTHDLNHLVSVGDEGFYCIKNATDWTENCGEGVDTLAFTQLTNIDVMSFHLYPDHWGKTAAWGTDWIWSRSRVKPLRRWTSRAPMAACTPFRGGSR